MEFRDLKAQYLALKDEIDEAVGRALSGGSFILGAQVEALERELASYVGAAHCVTCANGTDALSLALMVWGIGEGDAVFVPDFTFFASAEVIARAGATPVFVDIDSKTFNMCPEALAHVVSVVEKEGALTPKAVIAVDLFGQPAEYDKLRPVCEAHGLKLLEDGAQGFGGAAGEKRACSLGDMGTTSFFPAKPLGCYGDGGAVFTNSDEEAALLFSLRSHGKGNDRYDNVRVGVNSRLDTLQAAILLVKLRAFQKNELALVNEKAQRYAELLTDAVKKPYIKGGYRSSFAQYSILLKDEAQRDGLKGHLKKQGIPAQVYYPRPMHRQKAFAYLKPQAWENKNTAEVCGRILALPMGPYLSDEDIETICGHINGFCR
ncbi:MAG TPA: aminotransferase DegT [Clostridiales bacterium]|nr:aminotransferase DegT [Clostridiales bacterium]